MSTTIDIFQIEHPYNPDQRASQRGDAVGHQQFWGYWRWWIWIVLHRRSAHCHVARPAPCFVPYKQHSVANLCFTNKTDRPTPRTRMAQVAMCQSACFCGNTNGQRQCHGTLRPAAPLHWFFFCCKCCLTILVVNRGNLDRGVRWRDRSP